ncbi:AraC family transcriptional regulator [Ascidiimonas sp. W6]|uniref:AraC family transcriptional regulator n=1 Tax=Ascidiimonas meishanensis TaxID=3128903 RepID=UPI0030EC432C
MKLIKKVNNMNDRLINEELGKISNHLAGDITELNGILQWSPSPSKGTGNIKYATLENGIDAFEMSLKMFEKTNFLFRSFQKETVLFVYCLKGKCFHSFSEEQEEVQLEEYQTAVILQNRDIESNLIIQAQSEVILSVIRIDKALYFERFKNSPDSENLKVLTDLFEKKEMHLHLGMSNLEIGEQVKLLEKIKHKTSMSLLLRFGGLCQLILANQIDQFVQEIQQKYKPTGLTNNELSRLEKLNEHILNHPELPHSLRSLSLYSGLSPIKLQEGFKFLHGRTVTDCIRNMRLEKAEMLIRTTDLNISEIVYTIGLTSRSYFCKCFKEKYKFSPKQYKTRIKQNKELNLS